MIQIPQNHINYSITIKIRKKGKKKAQVLYCMIKKILGCIDMRKTNIIAKKRKTRRKKSSILYCEQIEFPAKLLDYFLLSNNNNINPYTLYCTKQVLYCIHVRKTNIPWKFHRMRLVLRITN